MTNLSFGGGEFEVLLDFPNRDVVVYNGGRVLTIADGIADGACRPGIERFRDQHFPGRDSVTVGELAHYIANRDVERVLRHALFRS